MLERKLERKIEDLQQEIESLHASDVQQKYDNLQPKYDNLQQTFSTQVEKVSKLKGECADLICAVWKGFVYAPDV